MYPHAGKVALCSILALLHFGNAELVFVTDQAEFTAGISSGNVIELAADITLTSELSIEHVSHLTIHGNGYTVDGQNKTRCFKVMSSSIHVIGLTVSNGLALLDDGGGNGGGMLLQNSNLTMLGSYLSDNVAAGTGGGIAIMKQSIATLLSTSIAGNSGGGVFIDVSHVNMSSCNVLYNSNNQVGGGISIVGSNVTITNTIVNGNTASKYAGGIWIASYGSFAAPFAAVVTMTGCEISGNVVDAVGIANGGGIYINQTLFGTASEPQVVVMGSVFADNTCGESTSNDIVVGDGAYLGVFSLCAEDQFNAGSGALMCEPADACGDSAADLSGPCSPCAAGTFACCGSESCDATAPACTATEDAVCDSAGQ
jgi:hypothetical protein